MEEESIDLSELSAKERRKIKREERKKMMDERTAILEKLKPAAPGERMSFSENRYPGSIETDWLYYSEGIWCHRSEEVYFKSEYRLCPETLNWVNKRSMVRDQDGKYISVDGAKKRGLQRCEHSNHFVPKDELIEVYSNSTKKVMIWKRCVYNGDTFTCDYTKRLTLSSYSARIRGSSVYKLVQRNLINNEVFAQCSHCSNNYVVGNGIRRYSDSGNYECDDCHETRVLGQVIHPHNYNGYPKPIVNTRHCYRMDGPTATDEHGFTSVGEGRRLKKVAITTKRLYGVEAETEIYRKGAEKDGLKRQKLAANVIEALGSDFVIVKEDGTLTANEHYSKRTGYAGFEIVTAPADIDTHRERWVKLHNMVGFKHLRAWDEYDTCGFHIHVSRAPLTHLQIGRILMFINHKNNAKFIHNVAGRGSDRFCKYIPKEPEDKTHPATDVLYVKQRVISKEEEDQRNRSRRVAVNLSNPATIEFRIFRGTVHPRHIIRNIEFVDAVCDFCYPANYSINDMANYKVFIAFVNENRKKYPLFAEWLAEQKIIALKAIASGKADLSKRTLKIEEVVEKVAADRVKTAEPSDALPPPGLYAEAPASPSLTFSPSGGITLSASDPVMQFKITPEPWPEAYTYTLGSTKPAKLSKKGKNVVPKMSTAQMAALQALEEEAAEVAEAMHEEQGNG